MLDDTMMKAQIMAQYQQVMFQSLPCILFMDIATRTNMAVSPEVDFTAGVTEHSQRLCSSCQQHANTSPAPRKVMPSRAEPAQ